MSVQEPVINHFTNTSTNNKWIKKADVGGGPRGWAFAFSINGKGYAGGGDPTGNFSTFLKDVWEYDPSMDIWTQKGDFPGAGRDAAFSFVLNGIAYMGCGYNGSILSIFGNMTLPAINGQVLEITLAVLFSLLFLLSIMLHIFVEEELLHVLNLMHRQKILH